MIELATGNLLDADTEALVNTVNTVGVMGKGIALQFKRAFPANFKAYRAACQRDEVVPGKVFAFDRGGFAAPRWILNLPTKRHWRARSRLDDIEAGLEDLKRVLTELEIASVAVPPLGCGHGGLAWSVVRPRIEKALGDLPIRVMLFAPGHAPPPERMRVRGPRPALTRFRAAILLLLDRYRLAGYTSSALEAQKLAYLLQASGQDLDLTFEAHIYGPYAQALTHAFETLEGHYVRGVGDQQSPRAVFELLPSAAHDAKQILDAAADSQLNARLDRVSELVSGFETPYGLELLASVHWLADHGLRGTTPAANAESAAAALRTWNRRKAKLFDRHHVQVAWDQLTEQGWLPT